MHRGTCQDCKFWDRENQTEDGTAKCKSPSSQEKDTETFSLYSCNWFQHK